MLMFGAFVSGGEGFDEPTPFLHQMEGLLLFHRAVENTTVAAGCTPKTMRRWLGRGSHRDPKGATDAHAAAHQSFW